MERYTLTQRFTEERVLALTEQRTILLAEAAEEKSAALLEQRAILESAAAEDKAAALKELKFLLESVAAEEKARALAAQKSAMEAAAARAQASPTVPRVACRAPRWRSRGLAANYVRTWAAVDSAAAAAAALTPELVPALPHRILAGGGPGCPARSPGGRGR